MDAAIANADHGRSQSLLTTMHEFHSGRTFTRSVIARTVTANDVSAQGYAAKRWGRDSDVALVLRAAVPGAELGAGDAMGLGEDAAAAAAFVEAVSAVSVIGRLQGLRQVPAGIPVVRSANAIRGSWTAEGAAIKVSPLAFDRERMMPRKVAVLCVVTNELLSASSPEAERLLQSDLINATAATVDEAFIDPTNAGSSSVPAAITYGAATVPSTGDLAADLGAAIRSFPGNFQTAAWILGPEIAGQIVLSTAGIGLGAGLGLRGGELMGLPAIVSKASPADSSGGSIALVDAARIVVVDDGLTQSTSQASMIEQNDAPTGNTLTPASATVHRTSMFQSGSTAIKLVRHINWSARDAVVVVTNASYA